MASPSLQTTLLLCTYIFTILLPLMLKLTPTWYLQNFPLPTISWLSATPIGVLRLTMRPWKAPFYLVGTLENGYVRNVPLPRIPGIQSTSQVASALTSTESHVTCYSGIAWIPTWSELSCSPEGFRYNTNRPFFPLVG
jgi:hypothetical protein